jgi:hypothetical protein
MMRVVYKNILFFFLAVSSTCIYSQQKECLDYIYLDIEKNDSYPQVDKFPIYFLNEDSVFRYNQETLVCVDTEKSLKYTILFSYEGRVVQCPVLFKYPDVEYLWISYYKVGDLNKATKRQKREFCSKNNINRKGIKNIEILYFGDSIDQNEVFFLYPVIYYNREKVSINKLYYGFVKVTIGRREFIAVDYKPFFFDNLGLKLNPN